MVFPDLLQRKSPADEPVPARPAPPLPPPPEAVPESLPAEQAQPPARMPHSSESAKRAALDVFLVRDSSAQEKLSYPEQESALSAAVGAAAVAPAPFVVVLAPPADPVGAAQGQRSAALIGVEHQRANAHQIFGWQNAGADSAVGESHSKADACNTLGGAPALPATVVPTPPDDRMAYLAMVAGSALLAARLQAPAGAGELRKLRAGSPATALRGCPAPRRCEADRPGGCPWCGRTQNQV